jgi:hypothetical protein
MMLALVALVYAAGCDQGNSAPPPAAGQPGEAPKEGPHAHKPGAHNGAVVEIGRDNYHAEAVFEKGGTLRLYLLGKDEARVQEVEAQTLTAYLKPDGGTEATSVLLRPEPQPGDAQGKTSRFVGKLPKELWGQAVEVTVPSITIAGERFRFGFSNAGAHGDDLMPTKVADDAERQLYLTPGGLYTEADIEANGHLTASQKFKGFRASHDLRPRPGDKVCPVTLTKANPKVTWVIGGKTYEFCCPPCVDEFVQMAKAQPELVKDPGAYVKK